jgi:hypothetical protein
MNQQARKGEIMEVNSSQKRMTLLAISVILFLAVLGVSWLFHGTGVVHNDLHPIGADDAAAGEGGIRWRKNLLPLPLARETAFHLPRHDEVRRRPVETLR